MHKKSFTLIEVLVVISILAVLVFLLIPNLKNAQYRARDIRRKADLKEIQKALELYRIDHVPQSYPDAIPSPSFPFVAASGDEYLKKVPGDPDSTPPTNYYYYQRDTTNNLKYTLCSCLENFYDTDKNMTSCGGGVCESQAAYSINEP